MSFTLSYIELRSELASDFLFLKKEMEAAFADFHYARWRLDGMIVKL